MIYSKFYIILILTFISTCSIVYAFFNFLKKEKLSSEVNILEQDPIYKHFQIYEKNLLNQKQGDINTFIGRRKLLQNVCDRYKDPFR